MATAIPKDVELPSDLVSPLVLLEELSQTSAEERGATPRPSKATMLFITSMSAASKHQFDQAFQKMVTSVQEAEKEASHKEPLGISLLGLGFLSYAIGKLDQAEMCYVRSVGIWDAIHGADNPKLARVLADTATIFEKQHKYQQALEYLERARNAMLKTSNGNQKAPEIQGITLAIANVNSQLGHHSKAQTLFQGAIANLKEAKHPSLATALSIYHKFLVSRKSPEAAAVEAELAALKK